VLLIAWFLLLLGVALAFTFPKHTARILHPVSSYYHVVPMILVIVTAFYFLLGIYKIGIARK
jgi:hypothetical protein